MKRSKFVQMLKIHLENQFDFSPDQNFYDLEYEASLIITIMESNGMLPPLNEDNYDHMDNYDRKVINEARPYFTWEPENG